MPCLAVQRHDSCICLQHRLHSHCAMKVHVCLSYRPHTREFSALSATVLQDHQLLEVAIAAPAPSATAGTSSSASAEPEGDGVVADPSPSDTSDVEEDRSLDTAPVPSSPASKSPNILAIVAAVLAAVVLCSLAVGCFLFFRKRRASAAQTGGANHPKEVLLPFNFSVTF